MMKKLGILFAILALVGLAVPVTAIDFSVHGDMNNRFLVYTNHNDWLQNEQAGEINDGAVDDQYGEIKYRFWFEGSDEDDNIKAVYAMEIGGIRFGRSGSGKSQGGSFSGDGVNVETRWAYLDFQLPFVESKARIRAGLQPINVNPFLWQETAMGLGLSAAPTDTIDYELAWIRVTENLATDENTDDIQDGDNFYGRLNFQPRPDLNVGIFGLYTTQDGNAGGPADFGTITPRGYLYKEFAEQDIDGDGDTEIAGDVSFWTVGVDGSWKFLDNWFLNWDFKYQWGSLDDFVFDDTEFSGLTSSGNFDLKAWFAHADVGLNWRDTTFTYTLWYASGDDDAGDDDFEGYLAIDLDRDDNLTIFEGVYADDATYFTERPYMLDKGFIMNKLAVDHKVNPKLTVGGALMYMLTAEDIEYTDFNGNSQSDNEIGIEINGYAKYMLYQNLELALNAGYLFAGDAMDAFEVGNAQDGNSDENIFVSSARIRYKF